MSPVEKGWEVEGAGSNQRFERKLDSVKQCSEHARKTQPSQLRIQGGDGRFLAEYTYGSDPREGKG